TAFACGKPTARTSPRRAPSSYGNGSFRRYAGHVEARLLARACDRLTSRRLSPAMQTSSATFMSDRLRLGALSFLMLFVELALIRWAGSNVLYLSYFSNFVLLGS